MRSVNEHESALLWQVILGKAEEITRQSMAERWNRGSSRGAKMAIEGRRAIACQLKIWDTDGMTRYFHIEAYYPSQHSDATKTKVEMSMGYDQEFWEERIKRIQAEPDSHLIVNHKFYVLGGDTRDSNGNLKPGAGFGGRTITFRRIEPLPLSSNLTPAQLAISTHLPRPLGPEMATRNLWYGGIIPPPLRDVLPDNAVFTAGFDGPVVMY